MLLNHVYTTGLLATLVSLIAAGPSYPYTTVTATTTHPTALAPFPFSTGKPTTSSTTFRPYEGITSDCLIMPTFSPADSSNLLFGDEETKQMERMRVAQSQALSRLSEFQKGGRCSFVTVTRTATIEMKGL
ncbi:hypothetical protein BDZ85DRAFT_93900 [Elsinoe ampelina]|uniref:Uncharacterized protein n=1 Tax=Elsinoe ampelina TaxID=302913 RepID=A0A6A6FYV2_9PEZI|nr:hypothetical protein BDZ85DRAFT_93900 [Elsinoe ampelina]